MHKKSYLCNFWHYQRRTNCHVQYLHTLTAANTLSQIDACCTISDLTVQTEVVLPHTRQVFVFPFYTCSTKCANKFFCTTSVPHLAQIQTAVIRCDEMYTAVKKTEIWVTYEGHQIRGIFACSVNMAFTYLWHICSKYINIYLTLCIHSFYATETICISPVTDVQYQLNMVWGRKATVLKSIIKNYSLPYLLESRNF